MILKFAQIVGLPAWAIKLGLVGIAALLALWAYAAWRDSVIDDYETDMQANVSVVTDTAEAKADAAQERAVADAMARMESDRREIQNAKQENRSPLDALFD